MNKIITSTFGKLNVRDWVNSGIIFIGSAVLTTIATMVKTMADTGVIYFDFTTVWHVALAAAATYLTKNLITGSQIIINKATPEVKDAVKKAVNDIAPPPDLVGGRPDDRNPPK